MTSGKSKPSVKDRILSSKLYKTGAVFTLPRAVSQLGATNVRSVQDWLNRMVRDGELRAGVNTQGNTTYQCISFSRDLVFRAPWVKTPTTDEYRPVMY